MSFFANPLAEEEDNVPPDYPLEQYDERKREDDFNELLVRSTKLEAEQRRLSGEAGALGHPDLVKCLQQNEEMRGTLEELWAQVSELDRRRDAARQSASMSGRPAPSPSAAAARDVMDAVAARMVSQASQQEALVSQLLPLVRREGAALAQAGHTGSPPVTAGPYAALQQSSTLSEGRAAVLSTSPAGLSAAEAREVGAAVEALDAQLPLMSAEEAALASAAVQQLQYGLGSWQALVQRCSAMRQRVRAKTEERRLAQLAAQTVAVWAASRRIAEEGDSSAEATDGPAAAPLSSDLAHAESVNRELSEENWQLEAVLSRLLAAESAGSLAGSALVQYVGLQSYARELEEETERLGRAVLFLRGALADPNAAWPLVTSQAAAAPLDVAAADWAAPQAVLAELYASRQAHIQAAEKAMQAAASTTPAAGSSLSSASVTDSASALLRVGLSRLQGLYDACLHAAALLSTYFEKQSASAAFLSRAMRGGGPLDAATMERVMDVALPDPASVQAAAAEVAAAAADVSAELRGHVGDAAAAAAATLAQWEEARALLQRLLRESAAALAALRAGHSAGSDTDSTAAALAAVAQQGPPREAEVAESTAYVHGEASSAAAALAEEAEAFAGEKAGQRTQLRQHWQTQQAETNKKLTWLMNQPNASLLLKLCAAEKERDEVRRQLAAVQSGSDDVAELQRALEEVRGRVAEATRTNANLQVEVEAAQARRQAMEEERAALLAFLS